jgi:UDP-galactopyranose mutase
MKLETYFEIYKNNQKIILLGTLSSCLKYIGLHKTLKQAIDEGYSIRPVKL